MLTERVPIIGPFTPSHQTGADAENILFSEVFDIDYLSDKIGMPILEWHEVKNLSTPSPEIEDIGCWSVWQAVRVGDSEPTPRLTNALRLQGLGEQMHVTEQVVKLIHLLKTYHLPLAPSRFKSFLETHMIHMLTSGASPRCSIHLAERRA
jgi:hypothetical protein